MSPVEVVVISGCFTLMGSLLAWFLARRESKDKFQRESAAPGAPTVQEIWIRQDKMENAFKSAIVLLGEVAEQTDGQPLILSRKHVAILAAGNYLPKEWDFMLDDRDADASWPTEQPAK